MPRPLLLLTFFFGRIPSNYLFGLETTGQRKNPKKKRRRKKRVYQSKQVSE
jgi:hypothetical protein